MRSVKDVVKMVGLQVAPRRTTEFLSRRSQKFIMRQERESGRVAMSSRFCTHFGSAVRAGPFAGMSYPQSIVQARNLIPKLVGTYESELGPWVEELVRKQYASIVNVGSADGYYAVGFAMRMAGVPVVAFDTDPWARDATRALASENAVSTVTVLSMCDPAWLRDHLRVGSLLVVDCEGYERILLNPKSSEKLMECDILVELHEHVATGIGEEVRRWFSQTHNIREVWSIRKDPKVVSELSVIDEGMWSVVLSEGRNVPQSWLLVERKERSKR